MYRKIFATFKKSKTLIILSILIFGFGILFFGSTAKAASCTGTVPAHAEMYFGDDMELAVDTPYVYSAINNWDKACEFTCSSGYNWNDYACAPLSYYCTGSVPAHAEMYFGDDMMLTVNTPYVYSTVNNWNKACEFTCSAGYLWNGYACVLPAPRCTGIIPNHAEMYFGDDMELAVDTPYVYSAVNNWNKACEFTCSSGYLWNGYACAALSYSCTGSVPAHAEMYFGDDMMLTVNTPYVYSTMNNWNKACEFTCNAGYNWNGYACVLPAKKCTGTVPAHAEMYFGDNMELTVDTPYVYSAVNNWNKACEFTCSAGYAWNDYACVIVTP